MSKREYHLLPTPDQHKVEEVISHIKGHWGVNDVYVDQRVAN